LHPNTSFLTVCPCGRGHYTTLEFKCNAFGANRKSLIADRKSLIADRKSLIANRKSLIANR